MEYKMKPDNPNDMGDIMEYIRAVEDFNNGNYDYETVQSIEDLKTAHKAGKMFVFTGNPLGGKILMLFGVITIMIGLIVSLIATSALYDLILKSIALIATNSISGGLGVILIVLGYIQFKRIHKFFIIVSPKVMVKSSIWSGLRTFHWKDVHVTPIILKTSNKRFKIHRGTEKAEFTPIKEVLVRIPKGKILKILPHKYILKEFFDLDKVEEVPKSSQIIRLSEDEKYKLKILRRQRKNYSVVLFVLTLKYYFEMGKFGTSTLF
jgi:hypothetical protein